MSDMDRTPEPGASGTDRPNAEQGEPTPAQRPPVPPEERQGVQPPAARGAQMKRRNPWLVWLVWPLITLGIYHFVWYYKINREMRDFDPRQELRPGNSLLAITLGALIIVPPYVSIYNNGNRIRRAQAAAGLPVTCSAGVGLVLAFVLGLYLLYYQMELNKVVERYGAEEGTQVPLVA